MNIALRKTDNAPVARDLDVIDLYGIILECASDLRCAGETIYAGNLMGSRPTDNIIRTARAAAERALLALDEYEKATPSQDRLDSLPYARRHA